MNFEKKISEFDIFVNFLKRKFLKESKFDCADSIRETSFLEKVF